MGLRLGVLCVMKRKPHMYAGTVLDVPDKIRLVEITPSSCKPLDQGLKGKPYKHLECKYHKQRTEHVFACELQAHAQMAS